LSHRRRPAAILVAGLMLAGCGTSSSTAPGTRSATTSTQAAPPATTSTTPLAAKSCPAASLTAAVAGSSGAAGTIETTVVFRNASSTTCVLGGYPGGQMLDGQGAQIATTVVRGGSYPFTDLPQSIVTLLPGGVAYFNMGFSDVPAGGETSCPSASQLVVTPPNAYDHQTITVQMAPCDNGTIAVSPVFGPGSAATQTTA